MNYAAVPHALDAEVEVTVVLGGRRFVVGFTVDTTEHDRRLRHGLGAVTDYAALHALWRLTPNRETSRYVLREEHVATLTRLPHGVCELGEDRVTRLVDRPVSVSYLVAQRRTAAAALNAVSDMWWAPIEIAVAERPAPGSAVARARRSGAGLVDPSGLLVTPVAKQLTNPTPLWWLQAELVYASWRELTTASSPTARFVAER